jgi:hypothetical protein
MTLNPAQFEDMDFFTNAIRIRHFPYERPGYEPADWGVSYGG